MHEIRETNIYDLIDDYDAILFDAYGVLVNVGDTCAGAPELIDYLNAHRKPFSILTNDASSLLSCTHERFVKLGLNLKADDIITSGSLIGGYFQKHNLKDARCVVLGPSGSQEYVKAAGGKLVSFNDPFDVLVIGDESGFPFKDAVDGILSNLFLAMDAGRIPHLVLPNPDLIFPKGNGNYGIAAGSIACILESACVARYGDQVTVEFARLGKPFVPLFEAARKKHGTDNMLMVGDQLGTDIKGANAACLESAFIAGGVSVMDVDRVSPELRPTFLLNSLDR